MDCFLSSRCQIEVKNVYDVGEFEYNWHNWGPLVMIDNEVYIGETVKI